MATTHVRLFRDEDASAWDAYVQESPGASCYHQTGWKRVVEGSFGVRTFYLLAEDEKKNISGVLPLALLSSLPFGRYLVSLPYFNYGGICANDPAIRELLLQEAIRIASEQRVSHVELRHTEATAARLPVKTSKITMKLSLPATADRLWTSFPSKLRSQIKRPQKEGMVVRFSGIDGLDDFYRIFATNMRDLGTPVYSKSFFANILRAFPNSTRICTVYNGDAAAASGFVVGFKDTLEMPWAASLRSQSHVSPNMLLYWSILSFACEGGYRTFDFGRCTPGEGTHRFKEQWGARPAQLYWHYWMRRGDTMPELNPRNAKYALAISVWKRLPLKVTTLIGPSIVKSLP